MSETPSASHTDHSLNAHPLNIGLNIIPNQSNTSPLNLSQEQAQQYNQLAQIPLSPKLTPLPWFPAPQYSTDTSTINQLFQLLTNVPYLYQDDGTVDYDVEQNPPTTLSRASTPNIVSTSGNILSNTNTTNTIRKSPSVSVGNNNRTSKGSDSPTNTNIQILETAPLLETILPTTPLTPDQEDILGMTNSEFQIAVLRGQTQQHGQGDGPPGINRHAAGSGSEYNTSASAITFHHLNTTPALSNQHLQHHLQSMMTTPLPHHHQQQLPNIPKHSFSIPQLPSHNLPQNNNYPNEQSNISTNQEKPSIHQPNWIHDYNSPHQQDLQRSAQIHPASQLQHPEQIPPASQLQLPTYKTTSLLFSTPGPTGTGPDTRLESNLDGENAVIEHKPFIQNNATTHPQSLQNQPSHGLYSSSASTNSHQSHGQGQVISSNRLKRSEGITGSFQDLLELSELPPFGKFNNHSNQNNYHFHGYHVENRKTYTPQNGPIYENTPPHHDSTVNTTGSSHHNGTGVQSSVTCPDNYQNGSNRQHNGDVNHTNTHHPQHNNCDNESNNQHSNYDHRNSIISTSGNPTNFETPHLNQFYQPNTVGVTNCSVFSNVPSSGASAAGLTATLSRYGYNFDDDAASQHSLTRTQRIPHRRSRSYKYAPGAGTPLTPQSTNQINDKFFTKQQQDQQQSVSKKHQNQLHHSKQDSKISPNIVLTPPTNTTAVITATTTAINAPSQTNKKNIKIPATPPNHPTKARNNQSRGSTPGLNNARLRQQELPLTGGGGTGFGHDYNILKDFGRDGAGNADRSGIDSGLSFDKSSISDSISHPDFDSQDSQSHTTDERDSDSTTTDIDAGYGNRSSFTAGPSIETGQWQRTDHVQYNQQNRHQSRDDGHQFFNKQPVVSTTSPYPPNSSASHGGPPFHNTTPEYNSLTQSSPFIQTGAMDTIDQKNNNNNKPNQSTSSSSFFNQSDQYQSTPSNTVTRPNTAGQVNTQFQLQVLSQSMQQKQLSSITTSTTSKDSTNPLMPLIGELVPPSSSKYTQFVSENTSNYPSNLTSSLPQQQLDRDRYAISSKNTPEHDTVPINNLFQQPPPPHQHYQQPIPSKSPSVTTSSNSPHSSPTSSPSSSSQQSSKRPHQYTNTDHPLSILDLFFAQYTATHPQPFNFPSHHFLIISSIGGPFSSKSKSLLKLRRYLNWIRYSPRLISVSAHKDTIAHWWENSQNQQQTLNKTTLPSQEPSTTSQPADTTTTATINPNDPLHDYQLRNLALLSAFNEFIQTIENNKDSRIIMFDHSHSNIISRDLFRDFLQRLSIQYTLLWVEFELEDESLLTRNINDYIDNVMVNSTAPNTTTAPASPVDTHTTTFMASTAPNTNVAAVDISAANAQNVGVSEIKPNVIVPTTHNDMKIPPPHAHEHNPHQQWQPLGQDHQTELELRRQTMIDEIFDTMLPRYHQHYQSITQDEINGELEYQKALLNLKNIIYLENGFNTEGFTNYPNSECYVRLTNDGQSSETFLIHGWLLTTIVFYLLNLNTSEPYLFFSRHGQSLANLEDLVGTDFGLAPNGLLYSTYLGHWLRKHLTKKNEKKIKKLQQEKQQLELKKTSFLQTDGSSSLSPSGTTSSQTSLPTPTSPAIHSLPPQVSPSAEDLLPPIDLTVYCSTLQRASSTAKFVYDELVFGFPQPPYPIGFTPTNSNLYSNNGQLSQQLCQHYLPKPFLTHPLTIPHNKTRFNVNVIKWRALNEVDAGIFDGLSYSDIKRLDPIGYASRNEDKFNYRYERGESYKDVIDRLQGAVIFELERIQVQQQYGSNGSGTAGRLPRYNNHHAGELDPEDKYEQYQQFQSTGQYPNGNSTPQNHNISPHNLASNKPKRQDHRPNILIVSHQAIIRALIGYFISTATNNIPFLEIPLNHVLCVRTDVFPAKATLINVNKAIEGDLLLVTGKK